MMRNIHYSSQVAIIIGFVLSLSVGFLDLSISMLSRPAGLNSFLSILPFLSATISTLFLIYVIIWFLLAIHLGHLFKLESIPLAISVSLFLLFLGTSFTIASTSNLIRSDISSIDISSLSLSDLLKPIIVVLISFFVSTGAYFAIRSIVHKPKGSKVGLIFGLAAPFVLAETMVLVWLQMYRIGSFFSMQSFLLNIGYIFAILFSLVILYRIVQTKTLMKLLTAFMILILLSPSLMVINALASKQSLRKFPGKSHEIKHVILIIVDTLRADVLSCYGSQNLSTPHVDQLARDGIIFTKAISAAPWTVPSVNSIMTGLLPSVHMATEAQSRLPDTVTTLAEYLHEAGYWTAAVGLNPFLTPEFNVSQGFLEYNFFPKSKFGRSFGVKLLRALFPKKLQPKASTSDISNLAINWLNSNYEKDFFLWIHYYDPHHPYAPPPTFLPKREPLPSIGTEFSKLLEIRSGHFVPTLEEKEWIKALYDSEVRYVDENIGKLIATLKQLGLYDESLIILTSDHGEEFWEHGGFEHGHTLYNEVLWVPLIIKLPLAGSKGQISKNVSLASLTPTILDLCEIGYESDNLSVDSLSLMWEPIPEVLDEQPIISTGVLFYEKKECVIFDGLKYIRTLMGNQEELYDLVHDPEEQISIASLSPDKVETARSILTQQKKRAMNLREANHIMRKEEIKLSKETIKKLKSLGYVR